MASNNNNSQNNNNENVNVNENVNGDINANGVAENDNNVRNSQPNYTVENSIPEEIDGEDAEEYDQNIPEDPKDDQSNEDIQPEPTENKAGEPSVQGQQNVPFDPNSFNEYLKQQMEEKKKTDPYLQKMEQSRIDNQKKNEELANEQNSEYDRMMEGYQSLFENRDRANALNNRQAFFDVQEFLKSTEKKEEEPKPEENKEEKVEEQPVHDPNVITEEEQAEHVNNAETVENINDHADAVETDVNLVDPNAIAYDEIVKDNNDIANEVEEEKVLFDPNRVENPVPAEVIVLDQKLHAARENKFNEKVGEIEQSIESEKNALATEKENKANKLRDNKNLKTQHQLAINKAGVDNTKLETDIDTMKARASEIEAQLANLPEVNANFENNQNEQIAQDNLLQDYLKVTSLKSELTTLRDKINEKKLQQKKIEDSIKTSQELIDTATKNIEDLEKTSPEEEARENNIKALEEQLKNLHDNKDNIIITGEGLGEINIGDYKDEPKENVEKTEDVIKEEAEPKNDGQADQDVEIVDNFRQNYRYNEKERIDEAMKLFEEQLGEKKEEKEQEEPKKDEEEKPFDPNEIEDNERPYGHRKNEEQQKNYVNLDNVNWDVDEKPFDPNAIDEAEKPYDPNSVDEPENEPFTKTYKVDEKKAIEEGEKILRETFGDDWDEQPAIKTDNVDEEKGEDIPQEAYENDWGDQPAIQHEYVDEKAIHELAQRLVREKRAADEQKAMELINGGSLEGHNPRNFDTIEQIKSEIPEDAYEGIYSMFIENPQPDDSAHAALFSEKLATFNKMYKTQIDANKFVTSVTDAFEKMKSGDEKEKEQGKETLSNIFKDTLKKAFDAEKVISYDERRLPDYSEIVKSTNDLMRASMFAFTDLYRDPKSESLFAPTAFGGLNADDIAALTKGDDTMWKMDQKSDEAWQYQSQDAKDLADVWLQDDKPYERVINEMNALAEANKNGTISRKDMYDKLAAAEWMLLNNEKMMVEDPEDPLNPIPNWGTRYWKSITNAREALGIDPHTSMRELIQGEYATIAKAVNSLQYNKAQIDSKVLSSEVRDKVDSLSDQKKTFEIQKRAVSLTSQKEEKKLDDLEMTEDRVRISVPSEDERTNMKNETKEYNFIVDKSAELEINRTQDNLKV